MALCFFSLHPVQHDTVSPLPNVSRISRVEEEEYKERGGRPSCVSEDYFGLVQPVSEASSSDAEGSAGSRRATRQRGSEDWSSNRVPVNHPRKAKYVLESF